MSVSGTGLFAFHPIPQVSEVQPVGWYVGRGTVTGDGTGGNADVTWTLPEDFVYHLDYVSGTLATTAAQYNLQMMLNTGVLIDGNAEFVQGGVEMTLVTGSNQRGFVEPPSLLFRPDQAPVLQARTDNVNGIVFLAYFRMLAFERETFQRNPFILTNANITH